MLRNLIERLKQNDPTVAEESFDLVDRRTGRRRYGYGYGNEYEYEGATLSSLYDALKSNTKLHSLQLDYTHLYKRSDLDDLWGFIPAGLFSILTILASILAFVAVGALVGGLFTLGVMFTTPFITSFIISFASSFIAIFASLSTLEIILVAFNLFLGSLIIGHVIAEALSTPYWYWYMMDNIIGVILFSLGIGIALSVLALIGFGIFAVATGAISLAPLLALVAAPLSLFSSPFLAPVIVATFCALASAASTIFFGIVSGFFGSIFGVADDFIWRPICRFIRFLREYWYEQPLVRLIEQALQRNKVFNQYKTELKKFFSALKRENLHDDTVVKAQIEKLETLKAELKQFGKRHPLIIGDVKALSQQVKKSLISLQNPWISKPYRHLFRHDPEVKALPPSILRLYSYLQAHRDNFLESWHARGAHPLSSSQVCSLLAHAAFVDPVFVQGWQQAGKNAKDKAQLILCLLREHRSKDEDNKLLRRALGDARGEKGGAISSLESLTGASLIIGIQELKDAFVALCDVLPETPMDDIDMDDVHLPAYSEKGYDALIAILKANIQTALARGIPLPEAVAELHLTAHDRIKLYESLILYPDVPCPKSVYTTADIQTAYAAVSRESMQASGAPLLPAYQKIERECFETVSQMQVDSNFYWDIIFQKASVAIQAYQQSSPHEPFDIQLGLFSDYSFDIQHSVRRAQIYYTFFNNDRCSYPQKAIVLYALLKSEQGELLQKSICDALDSNKKTLLKLLKEYIAQQVAEFSEEVEEKTVARIMQFANSGSTELADLDFLFADASPLPEEAEEVEAFSLLTKAAQGIQNYLQLPRSVFGESHLGFFSALFDNARGKQRAEAYLHFIQVEEGVTANSLIQSMTALYALLMSKDGKKLQEEVCNACGKSKKELLILVKTYLAQHAAVPSLQTVEAIANSILTHANKNPAQYKQWLDETDLPRLTHDSFLVP